MLRFYKKHTSSQPAHGFAEIARQSLCRRMCVYMDIHTNMHGITYDVMAHLWHATYIHTHMHISTHANDKGTSVRVWHNMCKQTKHSVTFWDLVHLCGQMQISENSRERFDSKEHLIQNMK